MSNNEFNENELKFREERRKKVESFHLNIDESAFDAPYEPEIQRERPHRENRASRPAKQSQELNSYSGGKTKEMIEKDFKKADKRQKKEAKRREKSKAKKNKRVFTIIWLVMVIMAGVVLSKFLLTGINDMLAISRPEDNQVTIKIPKDATFDDVIDILYENNVIKEKNFFSM